MKSMNVFFICAFSIPVTEVRWFYGSLSERVRKDGIKLLYERKTTGGWDTFNIVETGKSWCVDEGVTYPDTKNKKGKVDIVTTAEYINHHFIFEGKVVPKVNNANIFTECLRGTTLPICILALHTTPSG